MKVYKTAVASYSKFYFPLLGVNERIKMARLHSCIGSPIKIHPTF
jgi:hypothetical protein